MQHVILDIVNSSVHFSSVELFAGIHTHTVVAVIWSVPLYATPSLGALVAPCFLSSIYAIQTYPGFPNFSAFVVEDATTALMAQPQRSIVERSTAVQLSYPTLCLAPGILGF